MKVAVRGMVTPAGKEAQQAIKAANRVPVCYLVLVDPPTASQEERDETYLALPDSVVRQIVVDAIERKGFRVSERAEECDWFLLAFRGQTSANLEFEERVTEMEEMTDDDEEGGMMTPTFVGSRPVVSKEDLRNLMLMGVPELAKARAGTEAETQLYEMLGEDRWYVGILAYDLRALLRREKKLIWATFVNTTARERIYSEAIATLMATAAETLGEDTRGMKPKWVRPRAGSVEIGPLEVIGTGPEASSPAPAPAPASP